MNFEEFFNKAVINLLRKKNTLNDIKKTPPFNEVPEEFWKKFEFQIRVNQQAVLDLLDKTGIETGIHCQATGCGKSYIILMYANYFKNHNMNGNIIIFTERVNILADFFDLNKNEISQEKKLDWKNKKLIDLDNFEIINRVTNKKKDWDLILKAKSKKTKILLINRAFLTLGEKYKDLNKAHIGLIIHDECHNTPSDQCYNMLTYFNDLKIPIVGFSATPLRTGEFNKERLINIYNKNGDLNILTNFNMIYAIEKNLILPPNFVWYEMPNFPLKEGKIKEKINIKHVSTVFEILDEIIPSLPNKKIIAWCGTIQFANKWLKIFNDNRENGNVFSDFSYHIDHSQINSNLIENNYEEFKKLEGKSILFCANKHREGSDIYNLDCCIFIDFIKNRGAVPFIQSIGRVLRKSDDKTDKIKGTIIKTQGTVIDSFISNSETYEKELVDKIIGYYISFENLSDADMETNKYDKYLKLKSMTKFDSVSKKITFQLNDTNSIVIDCKKIKWDKIVEKFEPMLQNKIKLSAYDNLKSKAKILKDIFKFHANTDFINEYRNITTKDKIKYNLPNIDDGEYLDVFVFHSWFDVLDIEHEFIKTANEAKKILLERDVILNKPTENWNKWCKIVKNLPPYPKYVWGNYNQNIFTKKSNGIFF